MHSIRDESHDGLRCALPRAASGLFLGGCTMQNQSAPVLGGPSGFGVSLSMTASPVVLPRDGSSQATITVTARDSSGAAMPNVSPRSRALRPSETPVGAARPDHDDRMARPVCRLRRPPVDSGGRQSSRRWRSQPSAADFQNATVRSVSLGLLGPVERDVSDARFHRCARSAEGWEHSRVRCICRLETKESSA